MPERRLSGRKRFIIMGSVLSQCISESRSRSFGFVQNAKAAIETGGAGLLVSQAGVLGGGVGPLTRQTSLFHHQEQYRHFIGSVFSSIRPIAQRIAGQPMRAAKWAKKNKKTANYALKSVLPKHLKEFSEELDVLEQHPFLDTIKNPNPIMVQWQLIYTLVASMELTAKGYWWIYDQKNRQTKKPEKQIWPLPSSWVTPKHEDQDLYAWYEVRVENAMEPTKVPSDEIFYCYYPDPSNPLGAVSPLQAQARHVVCDEAMAEAQRRSFSNGLFPGLALIVGRHPDLAGQPGQRPILTRDQREQILTAVRQRYRGVQHADDPIILDGVIEDLKPITMRPRDMDYLNSMAVVKTRIEQGFGTNPIVNGEIQNANRASAVAADDLFNTFCVNPKIMLLSQCLTQWARPMFDEDEETLFYIEEAKTADPDLRREEHTFLYDRGAISINEIRQSNGYPPIHGGDVAYIPQGLVPVHVVREDLPEPKPEDLPGAEQREQDRQDKIEAAQQAQARNGQQPAAGGKPAVDRDVESGENTNQGAADKAALVRMAKAFLRLKNLDRQATAGRRTILQRLTRDPKTHLITAVEKVEEGE